MTSMSNPRPRRRRDHAAADTQRPEGRDTSGLAVDPLAVTARPATGAGWLPAQLRPSTRDLPSLAWLCATRLHQPDRSAGARRHGPQAGTGAHGGWLRGRLSSSARRRRTRRGGDLPSPAAWVLTGLWLIRLWVGRRHHVAATNRTAVLLVRPMTLRSHHRARAVTLGYVALYPIELATLASLGWPGDLQSCVLTAAVLWLLYLAAPLTLHALRRGPAWDRLLRHLRDAGVPEPTCLGALAGRGDAARLGLQILAAADRAGIVLVADARDARRAAQYRRAGFRALPGDALALYRLPNEGLGSVALRVPPAGA
jgi:hypothetical protein